MYPEIKLPNEIKEKHVSELPEIVVDEWKQKHPNRCAVVLWDTDRVKAKLITQSSVQAKDKMERNLSALFENTEYVSVI